MRRTLHLHTGNWAVHNYLLALFPFCGYDAPALLYNGGMLWNPLRGTRIPLPELPPPEPVGRMAWYRCIPANVCGDPREELVLYIPWTTRIYIYTQHDNDGRAFRGYKAGPRQYNPRLMD